MALASGNIAERSAFLDVAQQDLVEIISDASVIAAMGEVTADRIAQLNDTLFVPNLRNGRLLTPRAYQDTDAIPLVGLYAGELVTNGLQMSLPAPLQRTKIAETFTDWRKIDVPAANALVSNAVGLMEQDLPITQRQSGLPAKGWSGKAHHATKVFNWTEASTNPAVPTLFAIKGRPLVLLSLSRAHASSLTLAHEIVHVDQDLQTPAISVAKLGSEDHRLEMELEAYHSSLPVGKFLLDHERLSSQAIFALSEDMGAEALRKRFADPKQPFVPTRLLKRALSQAGVRWAVPY